MPSEVTFNHFFFSFLSFYVLFSTKKVLRIVERNYSTLRHVGVSFKRMPGDWDQSRVDREVNRIYPIMKKTVSILKDRKSKMEKEMKILDND